MRSLRIRASIFVLTATLLGLTAFQTASAAPDEEYHDERERTLQKYTLEWVTVARQRVSSEEISSVNLRRMMWIAQGIEVPVLNVEKSLATTVELVNYWTIVNSPRVTKIEGAEQVVSLIGEVPKPSDYYHYWMYMFNQSANEKEILLFRLDSTSGEILSGDYSSFSWGREHLRSMPLPVDVFAMIFLRGISPFRVLGASLDQWKIEKVTPEEWTLRLRVPAQNLEAYLRLSRRHGDAPKYLELRYQNCEYVWEVSKFVNVGNTWLSAEVSVRIRGSLGATEGTYYLQRLYRTNVAPPLPQLRDDLTVRQWRERAASSTGESSSEEKSELSALNWSEIKSRFSKYYSSKE